MPDDNDSYVVGMRDALTHSKPLPPPVPEDPVRCRQAEGGDSLVTPSRPAVRNAAAAFDRAACTALRRIRPSMMDPPRVPIARLRLQSTGCPTAALSNCGIAPVNSLCTGLHGNARCGS